LAVKIGGIISRVCIDEIQNLEQMEASYLIVSLCEESENGGARGDFGPEREVQARRS